ncbi:hypothetical protein [Paenibacillus odorifer]|uniref:hypothetical protein n=1 Tax=Paenibacillus TaxID=44249 RepID=UPI0004B87C56|nr:hypothetical protein [Paenibacillus odorifer]MEC0133862.1 hypothetical protein [Paenibacillus odorifer]
MNRYPPNAQKMANAVAKNKLHSTRFFVKNFFFFFGFDFGFDLELDDPLSLL